MDGIMTKAKILVLFANAYSMLNERQEKLEGCIVHYMFWGEEGEKMISCREDDVNKPIGIQRAKCSMDISSRIKLAVAPAIYEGSFELTTGGDGKPVLKLVDAAYVCNVEMRERYVPGFIIPGMVVREEPKDTKAAK